VRTSAVFVAKNVRFFEIYGVSARAVGRRVEPVWTRRRGQFFRDFVLTSFMDVYPYYKFTGIFHATCKNFPVWKMCGIQR